MTLDLWGAIVGASADVDHAPLQKSLNQPGSTNIYSLRHSFMWGKDIRVEYEKLTAIHHSLIASLSNY